MLAIKCGEFSRHVGIEQCLLTATFNVAAAPDLALHLLSKKQVCDMLGVAQVTVWRWVRDGHLPKPLQLGPRRIAWRTSDLQAFLTRQEG